MPLQGDLKSLPLSSVLQDVAHNELTGTLVVTAKNRRRALWFERGKLRLVGLAKGVGPQPLFGLVALGKIDSVPTQAGTSRLRSVRSLVRSRAVTREDARAGLEHQMIEWVADVFAWTEARFEFAEGEPHEADFDISQLDPDVRLPVEPIVMEAMRRLDEWGEIRKFVASHDEVLVRVREVEIPADEVTVARIASLLDGETSLGEIAEATCLGEFAVLRAAADLRRHGAARPVTVAEAAQRARAAAGKKQHERVLRIVRFALEREPNHTDLHALAAQALEALERSEEAVSEYRRVAAAQLAYGEKEAAAQTYRRILALAPRDTFAHERLFALLLECGDSAGALQQGGALAGALNRAGLPDKAKEVYAQLLRACGKSDELLEAAGQIARRLGDRKEAAGFYRPLFDRSVARGDEEGMLRTGQAILQLDPGAEDVARRCASVRNGLDRKRRRSRRRRKLLTLVGGPALLLLAASILEVRARIDLSDVRVAAIDLLQKNDVRSVLLKYGEFLDAHPWSLAAIDTRHERDDLERRYVEQTLPKAPVPPERLPESLAAAEEVRSFVRRKGARERAENVVRELREQVSRLRSQFVREADALAAEGSVAALERIAGMTDPLASEAVERLTWHESPKVRRAAIRALGGNGAGPALGALVARLAIDPDLSVRTRSHELLVKAAGEDLGAEPTKWMEWLRRQNAQSAPGRVPPLQAVLSTGNLRVRRGEPVVLQWRLENFGSIAVDIEFSSRWTVTEPVRADLLGMEDSSSEDYRRLRLAPGEFLGGAVELRDRLAERVPGSVAVVAWSARVRWNDAPEIAIDAVPVAIEIVADE